MLRLTGVVTRADKRSGSKVSATGEVREWSFVSLRVLVQGMEVVEATVWPNSGVHVPDVGDNVDYAVSTGIRRGSESYPASVTVTVQSDWTY